MAVQYIPPIIVGGSKRPASRRNPDETPDVTYSIVMHPEDLARHANGAGEADGHVGLFGRSWIRFVTQGRRARAWTSLQLTSRR